MSDLLVELNTKPWFRQAIKSLGLPLPSPQKLRRPRGARQARPLADRTAVVCLRGDLGDTLAATLPAAGANPVLLGVDAVPAAWRDAGEAHGRPAQHLDLAAEAPEDVRADALVLDATGLSDPASIRILYDFFHAWVGRLARCGRVVVLGRPPADATTPAQAAARAALEGFARSLAKEIGRLGATAHVVYVAEGAEGRLDPLLRFLLSDRAAFLTGQPWHLTARATPPPRVEHERALAGLVALVTGAARGIGAATVALLAAEGAHVICVDRPGDEGPMSVVARDVGGTPLAVDITDPGAAAAIVGALAGRPLHILVHNAGITRDKTLARMKPEWWDQAVAVNLRAIADIDQALLAAGAFADHARIIALSSVAGIAGNFGQTNYAASKAGLVGYVRAQAEALAGRGITVNAVAPGFIETRLTAAMPPVNREVGRRLSALGQGGEPRDVAELISFLATPGASGLTGGTHRACGGMFIGA
ncbi:MAG: 3-oxoacyl-ACP reductase [bacterium]